MCCAEEGDDDDSDDGDDDGDANDADCCRAIALLLSLSRLWMATVMLAVVMHVWQIRACRYRDMFMTHIVGDLGTCLRR